MMKYLKRLIYRLRGEFTTEQLISMGMTVGKNLKRLNGVILDPGHCWLIEIGDNVTLAPRVHILCHDASTKTFTGYTKIAPVTIGDNVFVGAESVVLPGVRIGNNVVIGANSTVTHNIPDNSVAVGSPAAVICSLDEYIEKQKSRMNECPVYEKEWTLNGGITPEMKKKQKEETRKKGGFVV